MTPESDTVSTTLVVPALPSTTLASPMESATGFGPKLAPAVRAWFIERWHEAPAPTQSPVQPTSANPVSGVAPRLTEEPAAYR